MIWQPFERQKKGDRLFDGVRHSACGGYVTGKDPPYWGFCATCKYTWTLEQVSNLPAEELAARFEGGFKETDGGETLVYIDDGHNIWTGLITGVDSSEQSGFLDTGEAWFRIKDW